MNRADCKALRSAAYELADWAKTLRESHTNNGDWGDELRAKVWHDKHLRLVKRLRIIANAEQKRLTDDRKACEFQAAYDEGDIE